MQSFDTILEFLDFYYIYQYMQQTIDKILLKFNSEFHCKFQLWILYTKILTDPTLLSISEEHGVGKQRCFASLDNIHCFCPSVPYFAM